MTEAQRSFLVCASQRSGSTLLVESLRATGVAGEPEEFFHNPQSERTKLFLSQILHN